MSGFGQEREAGRQIVWFALLASLLLMTGCATTSILLDMKTLSADEIRKAEGQDLKFNAVQFEVLGGRNI